MLPGHHHGAGLFWEDGRWMYRCLQGHSPDRGLAEVRAARAGRDGRLSPGEANHWRGRLDYEEGLIEPVAVLIDLPDRRTEAATLMSRGVTLYPGFRAVSDRWNSGSEGAARLGGRASAARDSRC